MAALIRGLPKDESGISQILKKHTSDVWKQQKKKLCMDPIARLAKIIEETQLVDIRIWCIKIGIVVLALHLQGE